MRRRGRRCDSNIMWLHGWLVCRLKKGSKRACTTFAFLADSVSVAVLATATASVSDAAASTSAAAAAATTAAAAATAADTPGAGAAAVSRSPEDASVSSSSFIHGSFWRCGFLSCALTSCACMDAARYAAGQGQRKRLCGRGCGRGGKGSRFDLWAPRWPSPSASGLVAQSLAHSARRSQA